MGLTASGNLTQLSDSGYTRDDLVNFFNSLSAQTGATVEPGDVDLLAAKLMGEGGCISQLGGNPQRCFDAFREQYRRRGSQSGAADSSSLSSGSFRVESPVASPTVGGTVYQAQVQEGVITGYAVKPAPVASMVVGDMGVTADDAPTVGPTGLANPSAPINYATGATGPEYGYGFGGTPEPVATFSSATGGSNMTTLLLLGAAAVAAIYFLRKK